MSLTGNCKKHYQDYGEIQQLNTYHSFWYTAETFWSLYVNVSSSA